MSFRKSSVVIIDCGRTVVRAGRGVGDELLSAPTVEVVARVGLRKDGMDVDSVEHIKATKFLVGQHLDDALNRGEDIEIFWPFQDGDITQWPQAEAIWRYVLFYSLQLRRDQNEIPLLLSLLPSMSRTTHERVAQLCFERLNVAALSLFSRPLMQLFAANNVTGIIIDVGEQITDVTPIVESEIARYGVRTVPIGLEDCQAYLADVLKRSNTAVMKTLGALSLESTSDVDRALSAIARKAWQDGIIHVPHSEGEIGGAAPGGVANASSSSLTTTTAVNNDSEGVTDIAAVLVSGKEKAVVEAANARKKGAGGQVDKKLQAQRAALDLVDVEFTFRPSLPSSGSGNAPGEPKTVTVTLGKERHRFCEPLFDPSLLARIDPPYAGAASKLADYPHGLQETVRAAVMAVEPAQRADVWNGVFLTGDSSIKNLETALQSRLTPFLVNDVETDLPMDRQPTTTRMLKLPEYFAEYRDKGVGFASYLGAAMVAKMSFTETTVGKTFISKQDYADRGPVAIRDITY